MLIECELCGMGYCDDIAVDRRQHERRHKKWLAQIAACRYGASFVPSREQAQAKADAVQLRESGNHAAAFEVGMSAYYARSLEASGFSNRHPSPREYRAMRLNQPSTLAKMPEDAQRELIAMYGQRPGIADGRSYWSKGGVQ